MPEVLKLNRAFYRPPALISPRRTSAVFWTLLAGAGIFVFLAGFALGIGLVGLLG